MLCTFITQDSITVTISLPDVIQLQTAPRMHYNFFGHMRFTGVTDVMVTVRLQDGEHRKYHVHDDDAHRVVSIIRYYFDVEYSHQVKPQKKLFEL